MYIMKKSLAFLGECISIPLFYTVKNSCNIMVTDKNCEIILKSAPIQVVRFFMILLKYFPESEKPFPISFLLLASVILGLPSEASEPLTSASQT